MLPPPLSLLPEAEAAVLISPNTLPECLGARSLAALTTVPTL
jgi:hypothetical protein